MRNLHLTEQPVTLRGTIRRAQPGQPRYLEGSRTFYDQSLEDGLGASVQAERMELTAR